MSAALHITPGPRPTLALWFVCPCCDHEANIVGLTQDWYDTVWSCCRCGDSWSGGYLLERPFRRGWRNEARRRAQRNWYAALLGSAS